MDKGLFTQKTKTKKWDSGMIVIKKEIFIKYVG